MKHPFQKMQLQADSWYALIGTWAEMQLIVRDGTAEIIGEGYTYEIARALTLLVFDWEARILLPMQELDIPAGSYDLSRQGDRVHASSGSDYFLLPDREVVVEVVSVPELV